MGTLSTVSQPVALPLPLLQLSGGIPPPPPPTPIPRAFPPGLLCRALNNWTQAARYASVGASMRGRVLRLPWKRAGILSPVEVGGSLGWGWGVCVECWGGGGGCGVCRIPRPVPLTRCWGLLSRRHASPCD